MNSILPLIEAFLALGLTMIVLTTGVSSLVGVWQRGLRCRARGLRALLKCFFHLVLRDTATNTPENLARFVGEMSLQPARLAEVEGLDGEDEKSRRYLALLPDIAATPDKPAKWSAVWSSLGNTLDTLSEDEFKMRFKASSIGRKLAPQAAATTTAQADFDATLQAYYARFVAYGHASTEDFARDARRLSILAAIFLAIGANIDAFDLLETYIAQPTHRAAIIARYEQSARQTPTDAPKPPSAAVPASEAVQKIDTKLKAAENLLPEQQAKKLKEAVDEARSALQAAATVRAESIDIVKDATSTFPVGWDRYPGCADGSTDPRCAPLRKLADAKDANESTAQKAEGKAPVDPKTSTPPSGPTAGIAATANDVFANLQLAFAQDTPRALRWFAGVLLAILMLGLGTPFWIQTVDGLLRARDLVRGGNKAGDGTNKDQTGKK